MGCAGSTEIRHGGQPASPGDAPPPGGATDGFRDDGVAATTTTTPPPTRCADCLRSFGPFLWRRRCKGCLRTLCSDCTPHRNSFAPRGINDRQVRLCHECETVHFQQPSRVFWAGDAWLPASIAPLHFLFNGPPTHHHHHHHPSASPPDEIDEDGNPLEASRRRGFGAEDYQNRTGRPLGGIPGAIASPSDSPREGGGGGWHHHTAPDGSQHHQIDLSQLLQLFGQRPHAGMPGREGGGSLADRTEVPMQHLLLRLLLLSALTSAEGAAGQHQYPPEVSQESIERVCPRGWGSSRPSDAEDGGLPRCVICFEDLDQRVVEDKDVRRMPACGHLFHVSCIDEWLKKTAADPCCPMCRSKLVFDDPAPGASPPAPMSPVSPRVTRFAAWGE